ncbi:hypothetical protein [Gloeobacter morelensis]|uniref:Uncharacterized protein n=1 Tax=Gloeobacter morelensis MG652769 TaxID=2781736 RepID=A0ABY3PJL1_9CYAN|nr:hypothetical protein [Gloeobacter morelensis]UFP93818.1 hypothetical protein ISF26_18875 [Gloeobacter morelensis MG652769]
MDNPYQSSERNPVGRTAPSAVDPDQRPIDTITFRGEIEKGRDWVVFVRQMVSRLDSPAAWLRAIAMGVGALLMIFPKAAWCALVKLGIAKDKD